MNKRILSIFATIISGMILVTSCSDDFLEQDPVGSLSSSILASEDGLDGLLVGAYALLNGSGFPAFPTSPDLLSHGGMRGGEIFKGSDAGDQPQLLEYSRYNYTTGNTDILNNWRWNFDAVSRCNQILEILTQVTDLSDAKKAQIEAEARFLRGHYYFLLKRDYNNIPWIDETTEDERVPNTVDNDGTTFVNIWPQIAADFDFARKNLSATNSDFGRPNKWAAEAYYAKVQIYRANYGEYANGYNEALPILNDVINNGVNQAGVPYELVANYHDLFNCETENNSEVSLGCSALCE